MWGSLTLSWWLFVPLAVLAIVHVLVSAGNRRVLVRHAAAGAVGVHFEDYPALSDVRTPEWSHIATEDKGRWTRALVGILREVMTKRDLQRAEIGS